jgi:hypothetical protein
MKEYDTSWDLVKSDEGNMPLNIESFDRIYEEWQQRSWESWLSDNLSFPFMVERVEDDDDAYFSDIAEHQPFRLGHKMKVVSVDQEDDRYGVIIKVRESRKVGYVPLCDVEVLNKEDPNYWPVREYVVWSANQ